MSSDRQFTQEELPPLPSDITPRPEAVDVTLPPLPDAAAFPPPPSAQQSVAATPINLPLPAEAQQESSKKSGYTFWLVISSCIAVYGIVTAWQAYQQAENDRAEIRKAELDETAAIKKEAEIQIHIKQIEGCAGNKNRLSRDIEALTAELDSAAAKVSSLESEIAELLSQKEELSK